MYGWGVRIDTDAVNWWMLLLLLRPGFCSWMNMKLPLLLLMYASLIDCFLFDHRGRRFVLALPEVDANDNISSILTFSGARNTTINIIHRGHSTIHTIPDNGALSTALDSSALYSGTGLISLEAVEITADSPISLHVISDAPTSASGYMVLPTDKLSQKYFLVSPDLAGTGMIHRWSLVATEDNTNVIINLKGGNCSTPLTFTFNKYDVIGGACQHDITGSDVISDKPMAVIYSSDCTSTSMCRHIVQMLPPVMYYGNHFVLHDVSATGQRMLYKIVGSENNTILNFGFDNETLGEGEFTTLSTLDIGQTCLMANKAILVAAFPDKNALITLDMVVMQPVERFLKKYAIDIDSDLMSASADLYMTLTFDKNHLSQLPSEYKTMLSVIACCNYMTTTFLLPQLRFSIQLSFSFGAVLHVLENGHGMSLLLGYQYGARECPNTMIYSSESNMCLMHHVEVGHITWVGARDYCGHLGQQLPKLDIEPKNAFARDLVEGIYHTFFTGANDIDGDGVLTWQDGDVVNYTNWNPSHDYNASLVDTCVVLSRAENHTWAVKSCTAARRVLCQLDLIHPVESGGFINCSKTELQTTSSSAMNISTSSCLFVAYSANDLEVDTTQTVSMSSENDVTGSQTAHISGTILLLTHSSTTMEDATSFLPSIVESTISSVSSSYGLYSPETRDETSLHIETGSNTLDLLEPSLSDLSFHLTISSSPTPDVTPFLQEYSSSSQSIESVLTLDSTLAPTMGYLDKPLSTKLTQTRCPCRCTSEGYSPNHSSSQLTYIVNNIKHRLLVEKKNLTNRIARYISRFDKRQSAATIGYTGITCLVFVFLLIAFLDVTSLVQGIFTNPRKNHSHNVYAFRRIRTLPHR